MSDERPTACPICGSPNIARIVWGLVDPSPELWDEIRAGRATLGGCFVPDPTPLWECQDCDHEWPRGAEKYFGES